MSRSSEHGGQRHIPARLFTILLLLSLGLSLCGCATTGGDSDIPWNEPQSWEGSPGFPGFDQR